MQQTGQKELFAFQGPVSFDGSCTVFYQYSAHSASTDMKKEKRKEKACPKGRCLSEAVWSHFFNYVNVKLLLAQSLLKGRICSFYTFYIIVNWIYFYNISVAAINWMVMTWMVIYLSKPCLHFSLFLGVTCSVVSVLLSLDGSNLLPSILLSLIFLQTDSVTHNHSHEWMCWAGYADCLETYFSHYVDPPPPHPTHPHGPLSCVRGVS